MKFFQYLISRDSAMLSSRALSFVTFDKEPQHSQYSRQCCTFHISHRARVWDTGGKRVKGDRTVSRLVAALSKLLMPILVSLRANHKFFYNNHTKLSILHLCKIFAIVCREKSSTNVALVPPRRNGRKNSKPELLLREFTFPTWRSCALAEIICISHIWNRAPIAKTL